MSLSSSAIISLPAGLEYHEAVSPFRKYAQPAPLEFWHCLYCIFLGCWILVCGYSTYDLRLYASLLTHLSPLWFSLLFFSVAACSAIGMRWQRRVFRHYVAGLATILWGFTATYYLVGILHPMGFPTCLLFTLQQMTVFFGTRK